MTARCVLLIGTSKGAFILDGDAGRSDWRIRGPLCEGWPVHDLSVGPGDRRAPCRRRQPLVRPGRLAQRRPGRDLDALVRGADLRRRRPQDHDGLERRRRARWRCTPASSRPGCSGATDGGRTWPHVEGLTNHPTPARVGPGAGGLILHTIVPHPTDADPGCGSGSPPSACSRRGTAGATWETRNKGVRADFNPENRYPEFGQCVHKLVMAATAGERLYQQNHCGVYRSTDGGETWEEITDGPPVRVRLRDDGPPARPA